MTETTTPVVDTLTKARDILIERGVERGGWFINNDECKVCSMGAIYLASGGKVETSIFTEMRYDLELDADVEHESKDVWISDYDSIAADQAADLLRTAIPPITDSGFHSIPMWNDRTTTDAEVIEAFNKAIAAAN